MKLFNSKIKKFIFREIKLSGPKIKKSSYIFSKKAFLIFQETKLFKKHFPSSKNKKNPLVKSFLIFREMELSSANL